MLEEDDDEWVSHLSQEDLENLEMEAKKKLADRQNSTPRACTKGSPFSPAKRQFSQCQGGGVYASPKPRIPVKLFYEGQEKVVAETKFDENLVAAFKTIPGHQWDPKRRVWIFPKQHAEDVERVSRVLSNVEVQHIPPLTSEQGYHQDSAPGDNHDYATAAAADAAVGVHDRANTSCSSIKVLLFVAEDGRVGAQNPYHEKIRDACRSVTGRFWNTNKRMWTFPLSSFKELVQELRKILSPRIEIEASDPLVLPPIEEGVHLTPRCNRTTETSPTLIDLTWNQVEDARPSSRCNLMARLTENPSTLIDLATPDIVDDDESSKAKRVKLNEGSASVMVSSVCAICLESLTNMYSTFCGHVFHEGCIRNAIKRQKKCPTCRMRLTDKMVHRLFLDTINT